MTTITRWCDYVTSGLSLSMYVLVLLLDVKHIFLRVCVCADRCIPPLFRNTYPQLLRERDERGRERAVRTSKALRLPPPIHACIEPSRESHE